MGSKRLNKISFKRKMAYRNCQFFKTYLKISDPAEDSKDINNEVAVTTQVPDNLSNK